jgi:hypothetical protein
MKTEGKSPGQSIEEAANDPSRRFFNPPLPKLRVLAAGFRFRDSVLKMPNEMIITGPKIQFPF